MTEVSVIIPTYNRADKVVRAVSSVLAQTYGDFEIIVVDDGSTDETQKALAQFEESITIVSHGTNCGVSAARNTGIQHAAGRLIAFLDSDDHWLPQKLEVQTEFFRTHPKTLISQTDEIWIRRGRRVNPKTRHQKPSGDIFEPSLKLCLVSPSAVMLKKTLLDEVGLFDESLPACEDYDLWLRIACRHPVYLIPEPLIVKEGGHEDQLSARFEGMDRFRIKSLQKLITSGILNKSRRKAALAELTLKCEIYANGCLKRGKTEEGRFFLELPASLL